MRIVGYDGDFDSPVDCAAAQFCELTLSTKFRAPRLRAAGSISARVQTVVDLRGSRRRVALFTASATPDPQLRPASQPTSMTFGPISGERLPALSQDFVAAQLRAA